jgi:hypothetical protein
MERSRNIYPKIVRFGFRFVFAFRSQLSYSWWLCTRYPDRARMESGIASCTGNSHRRE